MDATTHYRNVLESNCGRLAGAELPWMKKLRGQALERFAARGFPSRRDEDWKNTDVAALGARGFASCLPLVPPVGGAYPSIPEAHRLVFVDGGFVSAAEVRHDLPEGVVLTTLKQALQDDPVGMARWLAKRPERGEHAFFDLNTALMQDGMVMRVPAGVVVEQPVHLVTVSTGGERAGWLRHIVILEEGAAVELIEEHVTVSLFEGPDLSDTVLSISLADEAELLHSRLQRAAAESHQIGLIHVEQGARSGYQLQALSAGGALGRTELRINQRGPEAETQLAGLALGLGAQVQDFFTWIDHSAPGGASTQSFRAVLAGQARAVFNGRVHVAPGAQGIDADQNSRALLLSDDAVAHARPQLEIYADDVRCTHGSTVGQVDDEALFYLRQRGLAPMQARRLLLEAFAGEIVALFPEGAVQERALATVSRWLNMALGEVR
jgi:Fe-S cluster assembly protein SufD